MYLVHDSERLLQPWAATMLHNVVIYIIWMGNIVNWYFGWCRCYCAAHSTSILGIVGHCYFGYFRSQVFWVLQVTGIWGIRGHRYLGICRSHLFGYCIWQRYFEFAQVTFILVITGHRYFGYCRSQEFWVVQVGGLLTALITPGPCKIYIHTHCVYHSNFSTLLRHGPMAQ